MMRWKSFSRKVWNASIGNVMLLDIAVFLAISAFIFRGVLSGLVFVGDLTFPLYPERLFEASKFAVYDQFNLGVNNILGWVARTPYVSSVFVLYELTRNVALSEFLYFFIIFWQAQLFMYLLLSDFKIENRFGKLLGSMWFIMNPWTCDRLAAGHVLVVSAFTLIPLVFWSFNRFLNAFTEAENSARGITYACITAIALSFLSASSHVLILTFLILITYLLFFLVRNLKKEFMYLVYRIAKYFLFAGLLMILLTSYWSWPTIARLSQANLPLRLPRLESFIYYSRNADILSALRGDVYWYSVYYSNPSFVWAGASLALPIIALLAPVLRRSDRKLLIFSAMSILGISLSLGSNNPANVLLFNYVPFFSAFQDPDKFSLITVFAYSFLLGTSVSSIMNYARRVKLSVVVSITLVSLLLTSSYLQLNNVNSLFLGAKLPEEYLNINELMNKKNESNAMWMPLSWAIKYNWAPTEANGYTDQLSKPPVIEDPVSPDIPERTRDMIDYAYSTLAMNKTEQFGHYLSLLNGKYIVFRSDLEETWQASYKVSGYPTYSYLYDSLLRQSDLRLLEKGNSLSLFENARSSDILFATTNLAIVANGIGILNTVFAARPMANVTSSILYFVDWSRAKDINKLSPSANTIIIGEIYDLVACLSENSTIECAHYACSSTIDSGWSEYSLQRDSFPGSYWFSEGEFVFDKVVSTDMNDSVLEVPVHVDTTAQYEILARVGTASTAGQISAELDGDEETGISLQSLGTKTQDVPAGFRWVTLFSKVLTSGNHSITLRNMHGFNTVDEILVLAATKVEAAFQDVRELCDTKSIVFLGEAEKIFELNQGSADVIRSVNASNGAYVFIDEPAKLSRSLFFAKDTSYTFEIHSPFNIKAEDIELSVDDERVELGYTSTSDLSVLGTSPFYMEAGFHQIAIRTVLNEEVCIDSILYYDSEDFFEDNNNLRFNYEKVSPSEYDVWIECDGPFFLGFCESYDDNWVLSAGEGEPWHFIGFDFINGYLFNSSFNGRLKLFYVEQSTLDIAYIVYYATLVACSCWIIGYIFRRQLGSFLKKCAEIGRKR